MIWLRLVLFCFFFNDVKFILSEIHKYQVKNSRVLINVQTLVFHHYWDIEYFHHLRKFPHALPGQPSLPQATTVLNTYHVRLVLPMLINETEYFIFLCTFLISVNSMWNLSDLGFKMITLDTVLRTDCKVWGQRIREQGQEAGRHIREMLR